MDHEWLRDLKILQAKNVNMFPVNLKIIEVLQDIVTFLHRALKEGADLGYDGSVSRYFMHCLQILSDFICWVILAYIDLLHHWDVLINEHSHIGIIEVPVVSTIRVMHAVGSSDVAKDVASDLTKFEHVFYAPFPDIPVGII